MKDQDYKYILFDAQYFLFRNHCALKSRTAIETAVTLEDGEGDTSTSYVITKYTYSKHDLIKQFYWTIGKFLRDNFSGGKIILAWDTPPYHKSSILPDFKGTRTHHCQDLLDEWDIEEDPQGYLQEKEEFRVHRQFLQAKQWIIDNLRNLGMPSIAVSGFEADDLACIFSKLTTESYDNKKSAICSADSDWLYWITDKVDFLSFNKKEVWTYQDAIDECEGVSIDLDLTIFQIKQWMDSTFYSHNDLQKTTNLGWKQFPQLVREVRSGDYTHILDRDRFELNMRSFEYWDYPNYHDAVYKLGELLGPTTKKYDDKLFTRYRTDGFQVSESYVSNLINTLDDDLYLT